MQVCQWEVTTRSSAKRVDFIVLKEVNQESPTGNVLTTSSSPAAAGTPKKTQEKIVHRSAVFHGIFPRAS